MVQGIWIKDKKIEKIKNWHKPKLIPDLQVFLGFANFYWQFVWSFDKIARPLISILRIVNLLENLLLLVNVDEEDKMLGSNRFSGKIKNLSKLQKLKIPMVVSNVSANAKNIGF